MPLFLAQPRLARILLAMSLVAVQAKQSLAQKPDVDKNLANAGVAFLNNYCKKCHGDDNAYPGLDVTDRATLLKPIINDEEPFLVPGNLKKSRLWDAIESEYMPPDDQPPRSPRSKSGSNPRRPFPKRFACNVSSLPNRPCCNSSPMI